VQHSDAPPRPIPGNARKTRRKRPAGHVATARGRKKNVPLLVDTGHRSRPDLSQHLPAPAFSPFDACLLPLPLFHFIFRQFAEPGAGLRDCEWCSASLHPVSSHHRGQPDPLAGASEKILTCNCKCLQRRQQCLRDSFFSEQRTWLLQEFIHPNSLEQETFHPQANKQDASNTECRNASKFLFKL